MTSLPSRLLLWTLCSVLGCALANAELLYRTDFEDFSAGPDQWVGLGVTEGYKGWIGDNVGAGIHGIDQDVIFGGGLGKTAFLGFAQPLSSFVSVARPVGYNPEPGDLPVVEVETLVGIQDSITKTNRDSFFVSVLNSEGGFLAGIQFSNQPASFGIWREDGVAVSDTGVLFFRGELHLLYLQVDLEANRWSADLDGVPLFENETFTATNLPVNFGQLAYEWQLSAGNPSNHGDNWMLVADTVVRSAPREPVTLSSFVYEAGTSTLTWSALKGYDYQVEYSPDLETWFDDLPGSSFPGIVSNQTLTFFDTPGNACRYYRILQSFTP